MRSPLISADVCAPGVDVRRLGISVSSDQTDRHQAPLKRSASLVPWTKFEFDRQLSSRLALVPLRCAQSKLHLTRQLNA